MALSVQKATTFSFLNFPPELRSMVYRHLWLERGDVEVCIDMNGSSSILFDFPYGTGRHCRDHTLWKLARSCLLCYCEALGWVYRKVFFHFGLSPPHNRRMRLHTRLLGTMIAVLQPDYLTHLDIIMYPRSVDFSLAEDLLERMDFGVRLTRFRMTIFGCQGEDSADVLLSIIVDFWPFIKFKGRVEFYFCSSVPDIGEYMHGEFRLSVIWKHAHSDQAKPSRTPDSTHFAWNDGLGSVSMRCCLLNEIWTKNST
ncbi:hypothetical protein ANO11243_051510 [Dothideomycetidae sp. 11243]|nr:hypothetical protein ANO11243_051510 [fungal sp. No.11243]